IPPVGRHGGHSAGVPAAEVLVKELIHHVVVVLVLLGLVCLGAGVLRLGGAAEGQLRGLHLSVPDKGDGSALASGVTLAAHSGGQIAAGGNESAVDHGDHIAHLEARRFGGATGHDLLNVGPGADAGLRVIRGVGYAHAHVGAGGDLAVFNNVLNHAENVVNGDGEAQALHAGAVGGGGVLGGHDAHHLAVNVEQGAAGVAGVDGGGDLDHVKGGTLHVDLAVHAGDNALGHGEGQLTQGVADGKDLIPHLEVSGAAEGDRGQGVLAGIDLQHGQIVVLVSADDFSGVGAAVVEGDFHIRARRAETFADYVVVGDDVAV